MWVFNAVGARTRGLLRQFQTRFGVPSLNELSIAGTDITRNLVVKSILWSALFVTMISLLIGLLAFVSGMVHPSRFASTLLVLSLISIVNKAIREYFLGIALLCFIAFMFYNKTADRTSETQFKDAVAQHLIEYSEHSDEEIVLADPRMVGFTSAMLKKTPHNKAATASELVNGTRITCTTIFSDDSEIKSSEAGDDEMHEFASQMHSKIPATKSEVLQYLCAPLSCVSPPDLQTSNWLQVEFQGRAIANLSESIRDSSRFFRPGNLFEQAAALVRRLPRVWDRLSPHPIKDEQMVALTPFAKKFGNLPSREIIGIRSREGDQFVIRRASSCNARQFNGVNGNLIDRIMVDLSSDLVSATVRSSRAGFDWARWSIWIGTPILERSFGLPLYFPPTLLLVILMFIGQSMRRGWNYRKSTRGLWERVEIMRLPSSSGPAAQFTTSPLWVLSDLHIVDERSIPFEFRHIKLTADQRVRIDGNAIKRSLNEILQYIEDRSQGKGPTLVIAGDITDEGSVEQWKRCESALTPFRGVVDFALVPGNHDILLKTMPPLGRNPFCWPWRLLREFFGEPLVGTHEKRRSQIRTLEDKLSMRPRDSGEGLSAIRVTSVCDGKIMTILMDSNRRVSNMIMSNAIGRLGDDQLAQLRDELERRWTGATPLIVVLHHHPARCNDDTLDRAEKNLFLLALDGEPLLEILHHAACKRRSFVLLIHGHRHLERFGHYWGRVYIYGSASSTLGDQGTCDNEIPDMVPRCTEIGLTASGDLVIRVRRFPKDGNLPDVEFTCRSLDHNPAPEERAGESCLTASGAGSISRPHEAPGQ